MKIRNLLLTLVLALSFGLAGCDFGQVEQGRCVAFDEAAKTVTVVLDVKHDPRHPQYTGGIVTYLLPADPTEIGPLPTPGGRVMFDLDKGTVTIYNPDTRALEVLSVEFTDKQMNVKPNHPMVAGKKFPIIDEANKTITEYSRRLQALVTFKVPEDKLHLPPETWQAGDEVRFYYKENARHQALRFMNITRTNIFKR
ncbi:MAG: DUF4881 domain-containing protein [Desulfovibrionaceae bacterium]|nr:DUF4881 domain-containing protein [Desulfovibrionaceae bacterium]